MKKVLVLAAAAMLFAAPAFSAISNTAHDLSSGSTATIKGSSDQVCVYCHTPHGAAAAGFAPLWNRTTVDATVVYGDPAGTMDATAITPALVNATDAVLCLSCHDGANLTTALNNPPNADAAGGLTNLTNLTGTANLGTDLSNDHPIGFTYDNTLVTNDTELNTPPTAQLFGTANDQMWCSSCHDVHDDTNSPFLLSSNAGSALCLTCHIK